MKEEDYAHFAKTVATPLDYSEGLYLVYLELARTNKTLHKLISKHATITKELEFGYLCEVHMQVIPEIVRSLSAKNHGIYQIVRLVKLTNKLS